MTMSSNLKDALKILSVSNNVEDFLNILNKEISLPNIPMPTMGGKTFWTTLCEYNGWKIQQNMFTKHCRILNSDDVRIAWGTKNGMISALKKYAYLQENYSK
jgi:hypothetical protein